MKNVRYLLCMMTVSIFTVHCQTSQPTSIRKPGVHEFSLQASGKVILKCYIRVVSYSSIMGSRERGWGNDSLSLPTRTIIGEIRLWANQREVMVPLSCYADLTNPGQANLLGTMQGYRLVIKGGDGAFGYDAKIDFSEIQVFRRAVHSGEFPDADWEMTTYSKVDTTY